MCLSPKKCGMAIYGVKSQTSIEVITQWHEAVTKSCEATCCCHMSTHVNNTSFCWRDMFLSHGPSCVLTFSNLTPFFVAHVLKIGKRCIFPQLLTFFLILVFISSHAGTYVLFGSIASWNGTRSQDLYGDLHGCCFLHMPSVLICCKSNLIIKWSDFYCLF